MEKMHKALEVGDDVLITYGCLAHWMNLLGQDVTPTQIVKHVVQGEGGNREGRFSLCGQAENRQVKCASRMRVVVKGMLHPG